MKKPWKIIGGKRCLLKAGSDPFMQQPFNEDAIQSAYAFRLQQLVKLSHLQVREVRLSEDVERDAAQDDKLSQMDLA